MNYHAHQWRVIHFQGPSVLDLCFPCLRTRKLSALLHGEPAVVPRPPPLHIRLHTQRKGGGIPRMCINVVPSSTWREYLWECREV
jgi:hypothetical protein